MKEENETSKCPIAINVGLGLSVGECDNFEEFISHFGTVVYGLPATQIPKKSDCRRVLLRHLSRRDYVDIHRFVLCVLMQELEKGTSFSDAITVSWMKVKEKTGE